MNFSFGIITNNVVDYRIIESIKNQNIDNYEVLPPIFVISDFKGDYCDEGEWNISVIDGEHRIYSYSDKLSQMHGFFGIQKNNCKAGIESFNAEPTE